MPVSALIGVALTRSLRSLPIEWLLGYPISNAPTRSIFLFFEMKAEEGFPGIGNHALELSGIEVNPVNSEL